MWIVVKKREILTAVITLNYYFMQRMATPSTQ